MPPESLLRLSGGILCACVTWTHTTGVLLDCNQIRVLRQSFRLLRSRQLDVQDAIHAKFEDGVLYVELPAPQQTKALPENPNLIEIE